MNKANFSDPISIRRQMAADPHRPQFHFLPPHNWMNDPNGLFYWQERYHLFYQYNPDQPLWGNIHWGHASSQDLLHWIDHPVALAPDEGQGDENGCWSGCIVDDSGLPSAIYTGFINSVHTPVMLARAQDPALVAWEKSPHNPILDEKPAGVNDTDFRDPYVWRENDRWKMVLGAGMADGDGAVLLYESPDPQSWEYLGPLFKAQTRPSVTMWECPNFFKLGDAYVLMVSLFPDIQGVYYYVGDYDGRNFTPQSEGFVDHGDVFYAPQVRTFDDGRTIMFGWLLESRSDAALEAAGWAGVQTVPRELYLDESYRLLSRPIPEICSLWQLEDQFEYISVDPGAPLFLEPQGRQLDIEIELAKAGGMAGLGLLASPDGSEMTRIYYDHHAGTLNLDTTHASLSPDVQAGVQSAPLSDDDDESLSLRILLDGSVIEIWFDDGLAISGRAYPENRASDKLFLFSEGETALFRSLTIHTMRSTWPE